MPLPLTFGPVRYDATGSSPDGRRLFAWGTIERQRLLRYDAGTRRFLPYLAGAPASQVAASADGQWLAWIHLPDHTLWRGRADGTERLQLTAPPLVAQLPRWSPDGRRIVFAAALPDQQLTVRTISAEGGEPEVLAGWPKALVKGEEAKLWDPCWLADGRSVVFSVRAPWQPGIFRVDVETRWLRTGRGEVLADVHELRLDTVAGTSWMGLGPGDVPLVVEDQSTSDLYALDWEAP